VKDSFYEELECVFDTFPKYHMKILLGDFNIKVGRYHRNHKVVLDSRKTYNSSSKWEVVKHDVPQGTNLGPMFSFHISMICYKYQLIKLKSSYMLMILM
jgi:hypothetical protein